MHISTGQALLIACCAGLAYFSRRFLGDLYLERAIILGPVTGLILGDIQKGLLVGGTLELIFMGATDIGGPVPPNLPIGTTLGTAFAISAALRVEGALLFAIPAALLGSFFELLAKTMSTIFVSGAERYAERGSARGVAAMVHLGNLAHFLADFIPVFVVLTLGQDAVKALSAAIPSSVQNGIMVIGNILPALGFGILLSALAGPGLLPWFFLGFALAAYAKFGVLGTAFVGIMTAAIYLTLTGGVQVVKAAEEADAAVASLVPPSEQRRIFWRSFAVQSAFSVDRMQALGFTWTLLPFLKRVYDDTDEFKRAVKRHLAFFNTHPWIPGPIFAMVADLEARRARRPEEVDESAIQAVKGSLMGPLAGIGDSTFHGTLRPLMGGIAASLALQGNPVAPLFFFFTTNIVHVWVRWIAQSIGFRLGSRLLEPLDQMSLRRLMRAATMAGLMGVGGLVSTWLNIETPLTYTMQKAVVSIQQMLDNMMPKLLPLLVTLGVYWAIRRGHRTTAVMLTLAVGGLILGILNILK